MAIYYTAKRNEWLVTKTLIPEIRNKTWVISTKNKNTMSNK